MRTNRNEFPGPLKPSNLKLSKKNPGPVFVQKGNLLCIGWYDKKAVYLLTTVHEAGSLEKQVRMKDSDTGYRVVLKPTAIEQYNQFMGGVDQSDQKASYYPYPHRSVKW